MRGRPSLSSFAETFVSLGSTPEMRTYVSLIATRVMLQLITLTKLV